MLELLQLGIEGVISFFRSLKEYVPDWLDKTIVELAALFILVAWLKYERKKLQQTIVYHITTIKQLVLAARDTVEAAEQGNAAIANWEQMRELWSDARDRVEEAIDELDGRVRRKYANIPRYSYAPVIQQLQKDKAISERATNALLSMNERFLAVRRRPEAVTGAAVNEFRQWYRTGTAELPNPKG